MTATFEVKTLKFSIAFLPLVLLGHLLHEETFTFGF